MGWEGNGQVGKGQMRIIESQAPERVVYQLEFEKPFRASNRASFVLTPMEAGTELVWSMEGPATLINRSWTS